MSFEFIEFVDTQLTEKIKERYCNNRNKYTESNNVHNVQLFRVQFFVFVLSLLNNPTLVNLTLACQCIGLLFLKIIFFFQYFYFCGKVYAESPLWSRVGNANSFLRYFLCLSCQCIFVFIGVIVICSHIFVAFCKFDVGNIVIANDSARFCNVNLKRQALSLKYFCFDFKISYFMFLKIVFSFVIE